MNTLQQIMDNDLTWLDCYSTELEENFVIHLS